MQNPLRILVTGAGGLLGRELSGALADRGHAVTAMLHRSTAMHRNDGRPLSARPWDGALPLPREVVACRGGVRLTRAEQILDRRVTSLYDSYLQRDPWFEDVNLRALSGRTPARRSGFLARLIHYCITTGYLRGRAVQRTSG
jgi:hypothetical protein